LAPDRTARNRLIAAIDVQLSSPPSAESRELTELAAEIAALLNEQPVDPVVLRLALRFDLPPAIPMALALVTDRGAAEADRVGVLQTLGAKRHGECVGRLLELLSGAEPVGVQAAALSALQPYDDAAIAEALVARYASLPPDLKARTRTLLAGRAAWSRVLVDAVAERRIPAGEVTLDEVRQMLAHGRSAKGEAASNEQEALRERIESMWGQVAPATSREKQGRIMAIGQILAKGKGDATSGKPLVLQHCGKCHQLFGEGNKIGPDLTGVDRKNLSVLLSNVVDPSSVVRPEFVAYTAETADGLVVNGLQSDSTADSVTLLDGRNVRTTLARAELESLTAMSTSLMPERILDPLTDQELRDLFAYLQSEGPAAAEAK
jgi:putative heme-binding domain-containing protein